MIGVGKNNRKDQFAVHNDRLDVVRGIAALSVALLHCREINWIGIRDHWISHGREITLNNLVSLASFPVVWGSFGVAVFFVLSGYLIHSGSATKGLDLTGAGNFYRRRFIRIIPTLIAAMMLTLLFDNITSSMMAHNKLGDTGIVNFIANAVGIAGILGTPYGSNGPLWSLAIEMQFYAIYPLAFLAWQRFGPLPMLVFTAVVSLVGYLTLNNRGIIAFPAYYFSWWLGAFISDKVRAGVKFGTPSAVAGAAIFIAGMITFLIKWEFTSFILWAAGFSLILGRIVCMEPTKSIPIAAKPFRAVGVFSYSLYAVHLPLMVFLNTVLLNGEKADSFFPVITILAIAVAFAYIFYLLVERPSVQFLKRIRR